VVVRFPPRGASASPSLGLAPVFTAAKIPERFGRNTNTTSTRMGRIGTTRGLATVIVVAFADHVVDGAHAGAPELVISSGGGGEFRRTPRGKTT
jgi:hypothetical protein